MPRRRLTADERELWQRVARTATRLLPVPNAGPSRAPNVVADLRAAPAADAAASKPGPAFKPKVQFPQTFHKPAPMGPANGSRVHLDLAPSIGDRLAQQPVAMDRKLHKTMMRGKLVPEARIDLHGMTVAQAHHALTGFIVATQARGLRLVLVITGKGRKKTSDHIAPMPSRAGVLKHDVPHWLRSAPLAPLVLDLRESHHSHGGAGAYYVYLRKRR